MQETQEKFEGQLSDYITEEVRNYWLYYNRWKHGRREEKPEITEQVQRYWKAQAYFTKQRHEQENREFEESLHHPPVKEPSENLDLWYTSDAADFYGVTTATIINWCKIGKFPNAVQPMGEHGRWIIPRSDVKQIHQKAQLAEKYLRRYEILVVYRMSHAKEENAPS